MSEIVKATNITWHTHAVSKEKREELNKQKGAVIWLTGLSGSGKSTIANELDWKLMEKGYRAFILDGDNIRHGLNKDLGFSPEDRNENIRRIGEVAKLFSDAAILAITAFISPYRKDRDRVREILPKGRFVEVYVYAPLEVCEERDPKGLYKKAKEGKIPEFTGISAPYEEPLNPELIIDTSKCNPSEAAEMIINKLTEMGILN